MANWNLPTINSNYVTFVDELNNKIVDAGTIGFGSPINLPDHAIRFNRSTNIFEEWNLTTWVPKVIGVAGGGTGATDANTIRTNLGLGSMSTQNSNAVNITGGSITGVAFNASDITGGIIALARGGTGSSLSIQAPGTILMSNGAVVYFDTGINISQLNASNLVSGTVPAGRLAGVGILAAANTWTAPNDFNSVFNVNGGQITINGGYPTLMYINTVGGVNSHRVSLFNYLGDMYFQKWNDDGSLAANLWSLTGTGQMNANGAGVTNLNGSNIAAGVVAPQFLGAGAANSSTFLRGDGVWAPVAGGAAPTPIPSGMIAIFTTGCPAGWTRQSALDNRFPLGSTGWGSAGGSTSHYHDIGTMTTDNSGNHTHSGAGGQTDNPTTGFSFRNGNLETINVPSLDHRHNYSGGTTGGGGAHTHAITGARTNSENLYPPYLTVVFCQKD